MLSVAARARFTFPGRDPTAALDRRACRRRCRRPDRGGIAHARRAQSRPNGPTRTPSSAATTPTRSGWPSSWRGTSSRPRGRRGPARARALEGMTAVIVNVNKRYKAHAGPARHRHPVSITIRVLAGVPELVAGTTSRSSLAQSHERSGGPETSSSSPRRPCRRWKGGSSASTTSSRPSGRSRSQATRTTRATSRRSCARARGSCARGRPLVIAETRHGFVCASAGVDASNAPEPGTLVLLPLDPDASAARLARVCPELTGRTVAVIVSDSFGRPWRQGTTDVALGVRGARAAPRPARRARRARLHCSSRRSSRSPTRSPAPRSSSWGSSTASPAP